MVVEVTEPQGGTWRCRMSAIVCPQTLVALRAVGLACGGSSRRARPSGCRPRYARTSDSHSGGPFGPSDSPAADPHVVRAHPSARCRPRYARTSEPLVVAIPLGRQARAFRKAHLGAPLQVV